MRGAPASISELGEPAPAAFELGPEENQIEFQFAAVHFKLGETLRFQYRLEGSGAGRWSAPSEARWVNFASLKPGRYQFLVRTISADGRESAEAASVTFRIRPPLWATWWFELAAAALAAAIVYAAHLYRMRQILETARLRTRIATDLHDDIGSSLSRIAILTDVAAREADGNATLAERLERIGDVSREVVDSMSDIVWAVNPQNDSFADLAARMRRVASDLAGSNDVRLQFQTGGEPPDKQVGTMARREVFLIFKEALNNALRHSGCKQTEVRLCFDSGWISLEIADDGRGFDPRTAAKGNGLDSMRSRAEGLGGTLTVESAPGRGTRIHLRAPALGRFR